MKDNHFSLFKNKKRIPNLEHKRNYKLSQQSLKLYLNLGLQLNHRILKLKQEPFIKAYTKHNTDLRREEVKEGN